MNYAFYGIGIDIYGIAHDDYFGSFWIILDYLICLRGQCLRKTLPDLKRTNQRYRTTIEKHYIYSLLSQKDRLI